MEKLITQIEKWSEKYEFSFQFFGFANNNVWIYKDGIEVFCSGGNETIEDVLLAALEFVYRVNSISKTN